MYPQNVLGNRINDLLIRLIIRFFYPIGFERPLSDQEVMEISPQRSREISINIKFLPDSNHMHIHT